MSHPRKTLPKCPKEGCKGHACGVLETLLGNAQIALVDGKVVYAGYTDVYWDSQTSSSPLRLVCDTCRLDFPAPRGFKVDDGDEDESHDDDLE